MERTKTYRSPFIILFFIGAESFFSYVLVQSFQTNISDKTKLKIDIIVCFLIMFLILELLFLVYIKMTVTGKTIAFSKPLRRFSLFGRYKSKQYHTLKTDEWNELHFYRSHKGRGILCFFQDQDLVFYANLPDGESYAKTISREYLDKTVATKEDHSILRSMEKRIKKESPDRIIY